MKKAKIQEILTENSIQFDETATVEDLKAIAKHNDVVLVKESKPQAKTITVVTTTSMFEAGASYAPEEELEVTEERAEALGSKVIIPQ